MSQRPASHPKRPSPARPPHWSSPLHLLLVALLGVSTSGNLRALDPLDATPSDRRGVLWIAPEGAFGELYDELSSRLHIEVPAAGEDPLARIQTPSPTIESRPRR